jgi:putative membrane-bound dehydrogenase-like protein
MKALPLLFASLLFSTLSFAAAPKVVVWSDDPGLSKLLENGGIQVLSPERVPEAEVFILHGAVGKQRLETGRGEVESLMKRGGGLVVLGSGMESSGALKPWVGGAWTANSRKFGGLMMFYPFTNGHPITQDAFAFDVTDDSAYDLELDPSIQVLGSAFTPKATASMFSKKMDNRAPEKLDRANVYDIQPQMWTYEGAGGNRAFVLLQGSPETLRHESMRAFVLRGIAWVSKRDNFEDLRGIASPERLKYPEGGARTAEDTVKSFELMPGFEARVVASEPLINKAIAMQFDAKGRLWVAETPEYPNGRRPLKAPAWKESSALKPGSYERPATDRISILSDPDAHGKFTRKTVFYEGLELVTGFCLYKDGVIALHEPDIVYIHGEGKDQKVERLFTGFTPGDTHFVGNHLILAADGWVYANMGGGAAATGIARPGVKAGIVSGVFRFRPDGSAIEQVGSKVGNGFGLDISTEGEIFSGQATSGNPIQHVVLPEWVLAKAKVGGAVSLESTMKGRKVLRSDMPNRVPYMQIDVVGGYSAACASTLYEAGAWPVEWQKTVFCTEPILDVIHAEKLQLGAGNIQSEMHNPDREFLRATDFRFFPVDVQFGPEGAMYVLDFYNPIVAHSDSRGPVHGAALASIRPDREHYYGRIYRIQHREAKTLEIPDLTRLDAPALVKSFAHPNKSTRLHA